MGVPKFFRYISERYPCLSELVKETQIPEFDNLYLDMNGIIHNCSHPDDDNVHFRITEEQIFTDIFHYIDTLFRMIQPRRLFFMAVDGVAPRAKMNQQRGRRFRSAKESETKENLARQKGEQLPDTVRFDSNCITPGTAFMVRLQDGLKHFIQSKISTNPLWRRCRVILSGHETPGEGEHKIMEYIRYLKATPKFDPNTRHCLYGLDADLVMLGLCSHELQFTLLREEVKFGSKAKKSTSVDSTRFFLLHLGLMREYLEMEFVDVRDQLPFAFDMEAIVDDWILMCYLMGNDFIPNLPNFHINQNALPVLYASYKKVLPSLGGYINEGGLLNLPRLQTFLGELAEVDRSMFKQKNGNLECLRVDNEETFGAFAQDVRAESGDALNTNDADLRQLAQNTLDMYLGDDDDLDEATIEAREFELHKRDYYMKKMGYEEVTPAVLAEQAECYVRALQWTLFYYYRGVKSWCWYYPHHYAPYISDVRDFAHLRFDYEMGRPFLPFEQLLAVLPAASREHLPRAYHALMTSEQSRVIDYYPTAFNTDLNGKKQDWEAVVLIPFIDERRLIEAMAECQHMLTANEVARNTHGPMFQYDYSEVDQGPRDEAAQFGLTDYRHTYCTVTPVNLSELHVPEHRLVLGTLPGAHQNLFHTGFPTFKHQPYSGVLKSIGAKVFEMSSNNASMVVRLTQPTAIERKFGTELGDDGVVEPVGQERLSEIAGQLLGEEIFVGWPHIVEARVVAVSDSQFEITDGANVLPSDDRKFQQQCKSLSSHYLTRMGIDIGRTRVLVCAQPVRERKYTFEKGARMTLSKLYSDVRVYYALQTIVQNVDMLYGSAVQETSVHEVFALNSTVFMASNNLYYGAQGRVVELGDVNQSGRIRIELQDVPAPDFSVAFRLENQQTTSYFQPQQAANQIGMHPAVFGQITGTCLVNHGMARFPLPENTPRSNIGLQLKFPKRGEELAGFSKRQGNGYVYTQRAIDLVAAYAKRWPQVMKSLRRRCNDAPFETEVFGTEPPVGQRLNDLTAWLKLQSHAKADRRACGTQALEEASMRAIVQATAALDAGTVAKTVRLRVLPVCLYRPGWGDERSPPDASAVYDLFDRVVVVKETHSVPLGYRGTVVGIHSEVDPNPVRQENLRRAEMYYDVLFDKQFDDGGTVIGVAEKRMYKMSPLHLLNVTYGSSKFTNTTNSQRNAAPPPAEVPGSSNIHREVKSGEHIYVTGWKTNSTPTIPRPQPAIMPLPQPPQQEPELRQMPQQPHPLPKNDEQIAFEQLMQQMKLSASGMGATTSSANSVQPEVAAAPAANGGDIEQYQQIKLEDMFRVDTSRLPQPPSNWRTNPNPTSPQTSNWRTKQPQPQQQHHNQIHNGGAPPFHPMMPVVLQRPPVYQQQPPPSNLCFPSFVRMMPPPFAPPHAMQQRNIMPFPPMHQMPPQPQPPPHHHQQPPPQHQQPPPHHQQKNNQTFYPQPAMPMHAGHSGVPLQAPQGPQALRQNGAYSSAHGAFIPLQATRQQAAAASAASNRHSDDRTTMAASGITILRRGDTTTSVTSSRAAVAPAKDAPQQAKQPKATDESGSNVPKQPATSTMARPHFIGPTPKPSRIAAKFDMKP